MASKFKLQPDPTFQAKVEIPRPGDSPASITFTFKHRSKEEMERFVKEAATMEDDLQVVMAVATNWDLSDTFNEENVKTLISNYIAAPQKVFETYLQELSGNRRKN
jgi:hypothetical protein